MSKIGDYTVKGRSGTAYKFEIYSIEAPWNEVPGVYVITKRTAKQGGGGTHTNIYVGETENLKLRHANHHKQVCFMNKGANCLCFHYLEDPEQRLYVETDIRNNGNEWPCNDQ